MSYYALSIMEEILQQYLDHHPDVDLKIQIQSFLDKSRSWKDVLLRIRFDTEVLSDLDGLDETREHELVIKMVDAAHKTEDVIETHIIINQTDNNNNNSEDDVHSQLSELIQEFESVIQELSEIADEYEDQPMLLPLDHLTSNSDVPWYPKLDPRCRDDITFILENDFQTLKSKLIHQDPFKLRVISIHGNYGMGKRTLARRLFNDPQIASRFRTRAWVTSPFSTDEKGCLLNLLEGLRMLTREMSRKDVKELKAYIRNALKHIKYFIVIHDVVDDKNLITFTSLFRDYRVGARVLFTTIGLKEDDGDVSVYAEVYRMPHMSNTESWLLLRHKVFGPTELFPHELEHIGNNIVQLCRGNPLLVSLVAGNLATSDKRTLSVWELVATTLGSILDKQDYTDIQMHLSFVIYYHLPNYLRPCLLYTGAFYESRDIKASKVIRLWMAEGFVTQIRGKCLEDVAATYLQILIDKNLLRCTCEEPNGRVRAFQAHILMRGVYWILADLEKFLGSNFLHEILDVREEKFARRVSVHGLSQPCDEMELPLLARSFLSVSGASRPKVSMYLKLKLLRVLEGFQLEFYQFPVEIMQQVLLRYLAFSCYSYLSNSFSKFHYLQTLIIRRLPSFRAFSLPFDLWGLTQLRHVKCKETFVMIYPKNGKEVEHENLQTLSNMQLAGVTNHFLKQIPSIRNLGIYCNIAMEIAFDLACLDKLQTLKCSSDWSLASRNFLDYLTLPKSMRKLNLSLCRIPSKFMKVIGSLPNLELLKLQKSDFISASSSQSAPEWETAEGEFPRLVSLEMMDLNLVNWRASSTHLPELKHLVIRNCYALTEISSDIGNIRTLELIEVNESSPAALVSAMQIRKEQEGRGNKILQVRTHKVV